ELVDAMYVDGPEQRLENLLGRGIGDEGAAAVMRLEQPFFAERLDGLAHRRAADAELFRQFPLGREPIAEPQLPADDRAFDLLGDPLKEPGRRDGVEHLVG